MNECDIKTADFLEWPLGDIHTLAREICYKLGVSNYLYRVCWDFILHLQMLSRNKL